MTKVLALADQSKIGCITQRRFAKVGTKTHPQRGADLDRNGLSVSTETACRFEPKSPVGNSEICMLAHKIRESMASEVKATASVGGEGKQAEIDGAYFGGYVKPANRRENRRDRRLREYQSGKRQCVVVIRERDGLTLPGVYRSEGEALDFIRRRIGKGTIVHADESTAWNPLHGQFVLKQINHQEAYSLNGACVNDAESFFARMRRAEIGHHHHIAGPYLIRFAQEMAWREDHRRDRTALRLIGSWRSS